MNEVGPIPDAGGVLLPGPKPSTIQQKPKSKGSKQKKKATIPQTSIGAPVSDPLDEKTPPETPSKAQPDATPKRKGWKEKKRKPSAAKDGMELNGSQAPMAQSSLETIDPTKPSKLPSATPNKLIEKGKKEVNIEAKPISRELSNVPLSTPKKHRGTPSKEKSARVEPLIALPPASPKDVYRKQKKKSPGAISPKHQTATRASALEDARAAKPQVNSGSAGRAKIAKNLAHVFKAQQKIAIQHRPRKPYTKGNIFPFLNLPRELRDIVISHTITYDGVNPQLVQINDSFPTHGLRKRHFPELYQDWMRNLDASSFRSTPTIFLLNHQIYAEAQEILQKKTLKITNPPQYSFSGQFDRSRVISDGALENVRKVKFEMRTYPAKIRIPNNIYNDWRGKDFLKEERLAESHPWAILMKDCFNIWRSSQQSRSLEISIDHCSGDRSEYNLLMTGEKVNAFEKCIDEVSRSRDLDALVAFLIFAHVPIEFE